MSIALALAWGIALQEGGGDLALLRTGVLTENEIVDSDPRVRTESIDASFTDAPVAAKRYALQVEESGRYSIELRSYFFDAYLVLRNEHGVVLREDDDGLLGTHARITVGLDRARGYELEACALHGGRGAFELELVEGDPASVSTIERRAALIDDAERALEVREEKLGPEHPDTATSLDNLGQMLKAQGELASARPLFERALAIREKSLGPDDASTAASVNNLAALLQDQGDLAAARPLYERALGIWERMLGPEHPNTASTLSNLASVLQQQGDLAAARPLYERALATWEKLFGPEHPNTATGLNNLASLLQAQGDLESARALFARALAIRENTLGPDHPSTAVCLHNLALLLHAQGDFAGARPLYERALSIRETVLGPDHPSTATSLHNLALLLKARGELALARSLYERALAISEKVRGPDHPSTAGTLDNLGALLQAQGDFAGALRLYERALAIREEVLGSEHPDTAASLHNLAALLQTQGDVAGALPLCERALAIYEKVLGPEHASTAVGLSNRAGLLSDQGDFAAARPCYERALAICEKVLGPEHPDTATSLNSLAWMLQKQGDFAGARPYCERALEIREKVLGPEHPDTATSLNELAMLLRDQGDLAAARPLVERALAIWEEACGPEHPDTAGGLISLAFLLQDQGDLAAARPLLERALAIWEKTYGTEHPHTATTLNNLAALLQAQGDFRLARSLFERALEIDEKTLGPAHFDTKTCLDNLALLATDQGDLAGALELVERNLRARRVGHAALISGVSERESYAYLATLKGEIEVVLSLGVASLSGAAEAVLDWKGQVGRALSTNRSQLFHELDGASVTELEELRSVRSRISTLALASTIEDREGHERELVVLQSEGERLERSVARSLDAVLPEAPTLAQVRQGLDPGEAFVDFFAHSVYEPAKHEGATTLAPGRWLERRMSAWITRPDREGSAHVDLGPEAELDESVTAFLKDLVLHRGVGVEEDGRGLDVIGGSPGEDAPRRLRHLLWDPIAAHLDGVTRAFLSPDGALCTLPFETLTLEDQSFLLEHIEFVYEQSPETLVAERKSSGTPPSLLSVGGVEYTTRAPPENLPLRDAVASSARAPSRGSDLAGSLRASWAPLRHTNDESEAVKGLHALVFASGTRLLLQGSEATEERLKHELPLHRVVHIATHGFFNPEGLPSLWSAAVEQTERERSRTGRGVRELVGRAPGLLSGVVCAGANAEPEQDRDDGYLTAEEVGWLDLSDVELVVLSACETALGKAASGEGLIGLRRAFELAGAKTVVSSLWSVNDESTAKLMQAFYENLWVEKMGRSEALRAAQLEMLERNRVQYRDPRPSSWGAFVLSGEWR